MKDLKITVEQLRNYLGTGMEGIEGIHKVRLLGIYEDGRIGVEYHNGGGYENLEANDFTPYCYRLSDLDKEIEVNGERFVPLEKLRDTFKFATTGYVDFDMNLDLQVEPFNDAGDVGDVFINMLDSMAIMKLLFEWHFWPFGEQYFKQGLVIDKMKLIKQENG